MVYLARLRPWVLTAVLVGLAASVTSIGRTVPSIAQDPTIPPTPTPLLVAAWLASSIVLLARPVLPDAERLAATSMRGARVVVAGSSVLLASGAAGFASLLSPGDDVVECFGTVAALAGIGLGLSWLGSFAALSLPWLYVISGLALGYELTAGGPARLRPWAWLVEPASASLLSELVVLSIGVTLYVMLTPRSERE